MGLITIKGIEVNAIIGIYSHERKQKQKLLIDLRMHYDSTQAIASDEIEYALDYHKITTQIHDFVSHSRYQLIETLANAVIDKVLQNPIVSKAEITLWKPDALDNAKNVGFSLVKPN